MKLIHISDIHLQDGPILDHDPVVQFRTCLDHVARHHGDADMVVITGDLTHRGEPGQYELLKDALAEFPALDPILMIGNHDRRAALLDAFPQIETDASGFVQFSRQTELGDFLFLDTVDDGHHPGTFDRPRQLWLTARLEAARAKGRKIWLFMHHNPVRTEVFDADIVGLVAVDDFQALLEPYAQTIRHIFFGHCHYTLSGSVHGIAMSAPRGTSHPNVPEFTGILRTGYGPPAPTYNVCLLDDVSTVIHTIDFLDEDQVQFVDHEKLAG